MSQESVPFLNVDRLHASVLPELYEAWRSVTESGAFVGGAYVQAFEEEFGSAHDSQAVGCGSGTDAIVLALTALGLGGGDHVVVPSMTFVATAEAVVRAGCVPIIADVDPDSLLLRYSDVAEAMTARTRAVIPVHLYGHVVDPAAIEAWKAEGLLVIEDAAQAHLAEAGGVPVGSLSDAACFSFYPGKNLGALGDGGAVVSKDENVISAVRTLRDHGRRGKYVHEEVGYCSRLDGLQAAFLSVKLQYLPGWTRSRGEIAEHYRSRLGGVPYVEVVDWNQGSVHHLFVVKVRSELRDRLRVRLADAGIGTGLHYPVPLSRQPALSGFQSPTGNAEAGAEQIVSLPLDPLMGKEEVDLVCDELIQVCGVLEGFGN